MSIRTRATKASEESRTKLIENYLKSRAVQSKLQQQMKAIDKGPEALAALLRSAKTKPQEKDLFDLPPMAKADLDSDSDSDREDVLSQLNITGATDIHQIDLNSDKFRMLPVQSQVELLMELRERRKQNSWAKIHEMPKQAQDFSGFQLERLKVQ